MDYKITIYCAILRDKKNGTHWYVNDGWRENSDDAVRAASQHAGVKEGQDEIVRIDSQRVWHDEFYSPPRY